MNTYKVEVLRTGYAVREVEVQARHAAEAREIAFAEAGNHLYNEHHADYSVEGVWDVEEKDAADTDN